MAGKGKRGIIMNNYIKLKSKHQKEIDAFPLGFAFSNQQFVEMMNKWGLTENDTNKIYSIGGGGYIRKTDSDAFYEILNRHANEREKAMRENADDYLYHMFDYELANHEYNYTYDLENTLDALGLTMETIKANPQMYEALQRAIAHQESLDW